MKVKSQIICFIMPLVVFSLILIAGCKEEKNKHYGLAYCIAKYNDQVNGNYNCCNDTSCRNLGGYPSVIDCINAGIADYNENFQICFNSMLLSGNANTVPFNNSEENNNNQDSLCKDKFQSNIFHSLSVCNDQSLCAIEGFSDRVQCLESRVQDDADVFDMCRGK